MDSADDTATVFDDAADQAVALGNRLLDQDADADAWEVASGLLAGAIHFWLYTRQPCGDLQCRSCAEVSSAELRLDALLEEVRAGAGDSSYWKSPLDRQVGRA